MNALVARVPRLESLPPWARAAVAIVGIAVVYVVALLITGAHGWVHRHAPIGIILEGVVYGSVYSLGAMGLILVYRANRFINFSQGALGSLVGVLAVGLVKVHGLNYWIALPCAVIVGGLLGAYIEFSVFRWFRNRPRLVLLVASIGLAQVLGALELIGSNHEGFTALVGAFSPPFNVSLTIDVYTFHSAEILAVAVVPLVIAFLAWFLLRTNAGIAVRAAAENNDRALTLGIPVRRLSTIVWAIAGSLAVLTYMLSAPFEGVKPDLATNWPISFLPILTIAVVARMESLPLAFGAGIGVGIMEALVRWNTTGNPAIIYAIYLGLIVVALLAQTKKISRAKESDTSSWSAVAALKPIPLELRGLPEVMWTRRVIVAALALAFIWVPHGWSASDQLLAAFAIIWAMVGVSLVVLTGWSGQISLGQFGIAGVAGVVSGNMVAHLNSDFFLVMAAAAGTGAVVALLVGLPALRITGLYLAVTTLALAVALDQYFLNQASFPQFIPINGVPRPLFLQRFDLNNEYDMYLVCLGALALAILATMGLRKARAGRVLIATKDNERAASSASISTTRIKLAGFATAGMIAGVAGALDVQILQALNPGSFPPVDSITVFGYSVIGGLGSVTGVLIGILTFKFLESITALGQIHQAISGAAMLTVLQFFPGGLGQFVYGARDRLLRVVANRRGILVPSLVADKRRGGAEGAPPQEDLLTTLASGNGSQGGPRETERVGVGG
ncbi:MAG TPA: ABC transporter permease [Acidimicrobiales bacterium]|nr:ABC transporter permease [Acidimicrobiales bacterium]